MRKPNIEKSIVPKKYGNVVNNYGFSSTVINNGGNSNIDTNNLTVTQLNATTAQIDNLNVTNIENNYLNTNELHTDDLYVRNNANITNNLNVNGTTTLSQLQVTGNTALNGDLVTHGNVYHYANEEPYDKTFDIRQLVAYLGSENYFDELIGGDITANNITTDYLEVTRSAHFFELVIDKIKAAGGTIILTPADGFDVELIDDTDTSYYFLYWRACSQKSSLDSSYIGQTLQDTEEELEERITTNMWEEGDFALSQTFNLENGPGTYHDISNRFWWRKVGSSSISPVLKELNGELYYFHWISVYKADYIEQHSMVPIVGDSVAQLGSSVTGRQSAIVLSCYTDGWLDQGDANHRQMEAPFLAEYKDISTFELAPYRRNWIAANETTLRGNIKLENGTSVEDYVAQAMTGISGGAQFYTNLLVFENQNINIPCTYNGIPVVASYGTNLYAYHGNSVANITSISSSNQYIKFSQSGNGYYAYIAGTDIAAALGNNDTLPIPITVAADPNLTLNGTLYFNKIKYGEPGSDGITPLIYDVVTDTSSRSLSWEYDIHGEKTGNFSITPSFSIVYVQATDYSLQQDKIYKVKQIPTGMTLWRRYYNHDTASYTSWTNITSTFNSNGSAQGADYGYVRTEPGASNKYSIYYCLTIGSSSPLAQPSSVYDSQYVPLLIEGANGDSGDDGVGFSVVFDNFSSVVQKTGTLVTNISGRLIYNDGLNIDTSYDWNGWHIVTTTDNTKYNNSAQATDHNLIPSGRLLTSYFPATGPDRTTGQFSWRPNNFSNWQNYDYSYRPMNIYVKFLDDNNNVCVTRSLPIIYEAGASLEITDKIEGVVQDMTGNIAQLQATATSIQASVQSNTNDIAALQITASGINTRVSSIEQNYVTYSYLTGYATRTWTTAYTYSMINQSKTDILATVAGEYTSYTDFENLSDNVYRKTDVYTKTETQSQLKIAATGIYTYVGTNYETRTGANASYVNLDSRISQNASNINLSVHSMYGYDPNNLLLKTLCLSPSYFYGENSSTPITSNTDRRDIDDETSWYLNYSTSSADTGSGSVTYDNFFKSSDEIHDGYPCIQFDCRGYTTSTSGHPLTRFIIDRSKFSLNTRYIFSLYVKKANDLNNYQNITLNVVNGWIYTGSSDLNSAPVYNTSYGWTGDNVVMAGNYSSVSQSRNSGYIQFRISDNEWHRIWICVQVESERSYIIPTIWTYGSTISTYGNVWTISGLQFIKGTAPSIYAPSDNTEGELLTTGIDIKQGKITLNADNTEVTGDLDLRGKFTSENTTSKNKIVIDAYEGGMTFYGPERGQSSDPDSPAPTGVNIGILANIGFATYGDHEERSGSLNVYSAGNTGIRGTFTADYDESRIELRDDEHDLIIYSNGAIEFTDETLATGAQATIFGDLTNIIGGGYDAGIIDYNRTLPTDRHMLLLRNNTNDTSISVTQVTLPKPVYGMELILFNERTKTKDSDPGTTVTIYAPSGGYIYGNGSRRTSATVEQYRSMTLTYNTSNNIWYIIAYI